jgi:two-component system, NtrC family, response regulator HydG
LPTFPKHILCVDDHNDICELISLILRDYKVTSANSMAEALRLASKEQFSLYLLDYHLPDGTGIELCLLIKNFDAETPILFVTGTSSMVEEQALNIGAQGLIKKNNDHFAEKLSAKVAELLGEKDKPQSE